MGLVIGTDLGFKQGSFGTLDVSGGTGIGLANDVFYNQNEFVSVWNTALSGTGIQLQQITIVIFSFTNPFYIDWGDGQRDLISSITSPLLTHTYSSAGIYTLRMSSSGFLQLDFTGQVKLLEIKQFGDKFVLKNFSGCTRLKFNLSKDSIPAVRPLLGKYTTLDSFFYNCPILGNDSQGIEDIDTSLAVSFYLLFTFNPNINPNLSKWKSDLVTTFSYAFAYMAKFNASLNHFNTPLLTNLNQCFFNSPRFNQPLSNWNTGSVNTMIETFRNATDFDQDIGMWNVSSVLNFGEFMTGKSSLNYSASNYDSILNGWTNRSLNPSLIISFGSIKHTAGATQAKALLTRANSTVAISNAVDNGSGLIRITSAAHGRTTGEKIFIFGVLGTVEANGGWIVTVISATELDLQGSTFTNAYSSSGTLRIGYGWTIVDGGI